MPDINNINLPATGLTPTVSEVDGDADQRTVLQGLVRGETFNAKVGTTSLLMVAQEEMSFVVAQRLSGEISRRQVKDATRASQLTKLIEEYLQKVNDIERKDLQNFASNLLQQNIPNMRLLMLYMQQSYKDISHQYIALMHVYDFLTKETKRRRNANKKSLTNLLSLVEETLAQFEKTEGPAIRAGINVSGVAGKFTQETGFSNIQELRDFYRDSVLDYSGLGDTYREIIGKYGTDNLSHSVEFLLRGLAADMNIQGSSIEPQRLRLIVTDMYRLRVINSVYEQAEIMLSAEG